MVSMALKQSPEATQKALEEVQQALTEAQRELETALTKVAEQKCLVLDQLQMKLWRALEAILRRRGNASAQHGSLTVSRLQNKMPYSLQKREKLKSSDINLRTYGEGRETMLLLKFLLQFLLPSTLSV